MSIPQNLLLSPQSWLSITTVSIAYFIGLYIMANLFEATRKMRPSRRSIPDALVPGFTAFGLWASVIAALQIDPRLSFNQYSVLLSSLSLAVVVLGFVTAYYVALKSIKTRKVMILITGVTLIIMTIFCVMQTTLLSAIHIPGSRISWSVVDIVIGLAGPVVIAIITLFIRIRQKTLRFLIVSALGGLSMGWHYFYSINSALWQPTPQAPLWVMPSEYITEFSFIATALVFLGLTLISSGYLRMQSHFMSNVEASIEAMPVGLAFYDRHNRLMLWNRRYANLTPNRLSNLKVGMSYRDVLQSGIKDILVPANTDHKAWYEERLKSHTEGDWLLPYASGPGWIQIQSRHTPDQGLVTTVADFTAPMQNRIMLENELNNANSANQSKSRFLANMSHEIRTPLNGVIAVADALSRSPLNHQQTEMVQLIRQSSHILQRLLGDILDLARVESGQMSLSPQSVELSALIQEVTALHAQEAQSKGIQFELNIEPSAEKWVEVDPVRLKQILGNLLSNAVKFTTEGQISLTVHQANKRFSFVISDTGIGISDEFKRRIFGRFEQAENANTRSYGGSGLGLAICAELTKMMGGTLNVQSTVGAGSIFTATLPLNEVAAPPSDIQSSAEHTEAASPQDGLRVLLADDNATNRRVVQMILEDIASKITNAENGKEALEAYQQGRFDVVLMDMQMPVMDGLEAVRAIRRHEDATGCPKTPIMMLTANAMPEHKTASMDAGSDMHMAKPVNVSQLLEAVHTLIEKYKVKS